MPLVTDDFGTWDRNPPLLLTTERWEVLDEPNENQGVFRFIHDYDDTEWKRLGMRSYALMRFAYFFTAVKLRSPTQRIYPKPDAEIRNSPVPEELRTRGIFKRDVELLLVTRWRWRQPYNVLAPPPWRITVDYLQ